MAGISQLQDFPSHIPVTHDYFHNWNIRVVNAETLTCENYISPNRRDFYKVLFIKNGAGLFSLGMNNYNIKDSTILFLHPNEIISWRSLSTSMVGFYCLFKKRYVDAHPLLKASLEKHKLFTDLNRSIIRLKQPSIDTINGLFSQMHEQGQMGGSLAEEAMQAYLQLIIIESVKSVDFPSPQGITEEYRHIHEFFRLLETETSKLNKDNPIRIKTAKEFADELALSPNYLNALLKKHTGQNISTHLKNRLLEESKALLIQTDWTLNEIGLTIGFAEQSNFTLFFKKNQGMTPSEFRKSCAEYI